MMVRDELMLVFLFPLLSLLCAVFKRGSTHQTDSVELLLPRNLEGELHLFCT